MIFTPKSHGQRLVLIENARAAGKNARAYASLLAVTALILAFVIWFPWLLLREVLAGVVLGAMGMLFTISVTRATSPDVSGQHAEGWSVDALRKKGKWLVTRNLSFDSVDVDHVAVTPAAVLAVETKYRGKAYDGQIDAQRHRRELDAAQRGARKVRMLLLSWKMADLAPVVPVLMVWGRGRPELPMGHRRDGEVFVVDGDHPELWAHLFAAPVLTGEVRESIHRRVQDYVAVRQGHDLKKLPPLRSEMWAAFRDGMEVERRQRASRKALRQSLANRRSHGSVQTDLLVKSVTQENSDELRRRHFDE